jgi:hypothetical protein
MNDFLMRGPKHPLPPGSLFSGIKFFSLASSIEFIGEITQVIDSMLVIKHPFVVSRDVRDVNKFNLTKMHRINPIVDDVIEVHISRIAFMCTPNPLFLKNYTASRSGLVSAIPGSFNEEGTQ